MSTTREKFVERCYDIVKAKPKYELGASNLRTCDCIGMVKYGLRQNGVTLQTTGTNWTIRNQVDNVRRISGVSSLKFGDVVFKAREPGESGYNLPSKYRQGGSAYNGDLRDYCHIGVVKSVSPLKIIHMTSPTAKTDTDIGKWKFAAELKKQYISDNPDPTPEPEPAPTPTTDKAVVVADSGRYVKMRANPSTSCRLYDEVPIGAVVKIVCHGYDWTQVSYGKRTGWYMMTKFLDIVGDGKGKY
ncbi:MAG: C40 family peptidase [Acidaminococcaceae bacterium]|nr:C40 family peptidase [Acidaminococcaceae bacterium]